MRRIVGAAFVSLDGVMQAPGGPEEDQRGGFAHGGWLTGLFDEALGNQIDTLMHRPFDLLLGRRTWEIFAAHWPYATDDGDIADKFARCRKYVLTGTDRPLDWQGSERVPNLDALAAIREREGPDLLIQGSASLYPQLLARGMLDRLVLMTAPLVLGQGKRLFGDGTPAGGWTLIEHRSGSTGIQMATYEPAGGIAGGSFAMAEPSEAELARRERWSRED